MEFEADRMTGLVLTDAAVAPELKVVLEEQNQRVANNPRARLGEQIDAALYLNHPYGRPVIGWRHEIEKLNREEALAFYKRFYTPNNAVLVVAGDVTADEVRALAEADLRQGRQGRRDRPARAAAGADPGRAARTSRWPIRASRSPACSAPIWCRPPRPPSPAKPRRSKCWPIILGNGITGRLYRTLVVERELAVSAGGWYSGHRARRDAVRRLRLAEARRRPCQQLEEAIDAVIDDVVANGVTPEEVERAKNRLIADAGLRAGQPGDAGALVRRGADHRLDASKRARPGPTASARSPPRRCTPRRADLARQAALGDRLSDQGRNAPRGKTLVIQAFAIPHSPSPRAASPLLRRSQPAQRDQDRARRVARRHRGLAGARHHRCRWSR